MVADALEVEKPALVGRQADPFGIVRPADALGTLGGVFSDVGGPPLLVRREVAENPLRPLWSDTAGRREFTWRLQPLS